MIFLRFFLFFLILFSLSNWAFAIPCEEGFANEDIFVSFAKKQMGESFEKELEANWSKTIAENTKHWTRTEATQFLDFLINRIREKSTLEKIDKFSEKISDMRFNDFMNMVKSYDQINKDIIDTLIHARSYRDDFIKNHIADKVKTQQLSRILENYIGGAGTFYIINSLPINEINLNEIRKTLLFVNTYTSTHGTVTDTLENKREFFKQIMSLLPSERSAQNLRMSFSNFSEFIEFGRLLFEEMKKIDQEVISRDTFFLSLQNLNLQDLAGRIHRIFSGFSKSKSAHLMEIVRILEEYIEPSEIAELMMQNEDIYSANLKHLIEVISILKKAHGGSTNETSARELITTMMRESISSLVLANPTYLKNAITIIEKYMGKDFVPLILQSKEDVHLFYRSQLLQAALSDHLQRAITVLEREFTREDITNMIEMNTALYIIRSIDLRELGYSRIELFSSLWVPTDPTSPNYFVNIVEILRTYIDQKPVLLRRVNEIIEEISDLSAENFYEELLKMSNELNHTEMVKLLNSDIPLSELNPRIKEIIQYFEEDSESLDFSDPSNPRTLH